MILKKSPKPSKELSMSKNDLKINSKYDEYIDEKALRRQGRKKSKMPMESAFLKQISKIQQNRFKKKYEKKPLDSTRGK